MKKILLAAIAIVSIVNAYSQDLNPYQQFGYQTKNQYVRTKEDDGLWLNNKDTNSATKSLHINFNSKQIFVIDESDSIVSVATISGEALTRFISVDPLTKKYPGLTPYQFASNTPIQAIDLDGLEAFIIPGTTQTKTGVNFTNGSKEQFKRLTGNTVIDETFRWNAPINNDMPMRKIAAEELVKHIVDVRAQMLANKTITEDEPISLIGYSHGGNVGNQTADMLYKQYDIKVNVIDISTPAYNSAFGVNKDNFLFGNSEDPQGNQGINALIHVIHQNDRVWQAAKANMHYSDEDGKTRDFTILNNSTVLNGPVNSHTNLPTSQVLTQALSSIPKLPRAPAPMGLNNAIINTQNASQQAAQQQAAEQAAGNVFQNIPVH